MISFYLLLRGVWFLGTRQGREQKATVRPVFKLSVHERRWFGRAAAGPQRFLPTPVS
jgi:hypothetical protein